MREALNPVVSVFNGSTNPAPMRHEPLSDVLDVIEGGALEFRIAGLRERLRAGNRAGYDAAKRTLPAATFGGTFAPTRKKSHLLTHSGIIHGDLDHLEDVDAAKALLASDPTVVYAFISPSCEGLKLGVLVTPVADDTAYKHAWQAVCDHFQRTYGLTWDPSGKDVCRLCYLSHDADLYRNLGAEVFEVPALVPTTPNPTPQRRIFDVPYDRRERYAQRALETAVAMIDASVPGDRHHARLKASFLLGGYIAGGVLAEGDAFEALRAAVERNTAHLEPSLKTIADGLRDGQARPITLEELEAERQAWLTAHGYGERHSSQEVGGRRPTFSATSGRWPSRITVEVL